MKIRIIHIQNLSEESERLCILDSKDATPVHDFLCVGEHIESDNLFECVGSPVMFPVGDDWEKV